MLSSSESFLLLSLLLMSITECSEGKSPYLADRPRALCWQWLQPLASEQALGLHCSLCKALGHGELQLSRRLGL